MKTIDKKTAKNKLSKPKNSGVKQNKSTKGSKKLKQKLFISTFLKNRCLVQTTCDEIGISQVTYYEWMKDEEFATAINAQIDKFNDKVESVLFDKIEKEKDNTALIFYLKTKGKKRGYVEKQQVEVSGGLNIQILQNDPIE